MGWPMLGGQDGRGEVVELDLKNKRSIVPNADGANATLATHVAGLDYSAHVDLLPGSSDSIIHQQLVDHTVRHSTIQVFHH